MTASYVHFPVITLSMASKDRIYKELKKQSAGIKCICCHCTSIRGYFKSLYSIRWENLKEMDELDSRKPLKVN